MNKIIRSAVALLLILICINNNNVAFAVTIGDENSHQQIIEEEVINLSDMACIALDGRQSVIEEDLSYSRATTSVSWTVKANVLKKANTTFPMEAGECVTINCSYTPRGAKVEFGLIGPDDLFHCLSGQDGSINRTIRIDERGEYRFGVYNKSSNTVSVTGFIEY